MPANFQWTHEQTKDHVTFLVNIRGKSSKTIDVFVADLLIKISEPHGFLLILDTVEAIVPTETRIDNDGNILRIRAKKALSKHWDTLLFEAKKEEIIFRREQSILRREKEISKLHEDARSRRIEEERTTLKHQVSLVLLPIFVNQLFYECISDFIQRLVSKRENRLVLRR